MAIIIRILVLALPFILLERVAATRLREQPFLRRYFGSDAIYLLTGYALGSSAALAYVVLAGGWLSGSATGASAAWEDVPLWIAIAAAIALIDLGNYTAHLLLHRVDALWEIHKVHHSSRQIDWLSTFRSHILEQVLRRVVAPVGLIVAGLPLAAVVPAYSVFLAFAIFNHTNARMPRIGWLEAVFVTPRLHRLHHVPASTHRNLGTVFSFWDRLSGRLVDASLDPDVEFGVPDEIESYPQGWLQQLVTPPARIVGTGTGQAATFR